MNSFNNKVNDFCCSELEAFSLDDSSGLVYTDILREWGIAYTEKRKLKGLSVPVIKSTYEIIRFCPWCGKPLAAGLRDEWTKQLDEQGFDVESADLPDRFKCAEWRRGIPADQGETGRGKAMCVNLLFADMKK